MNQAHLPDSDALAKRSASPAGPSRVLLALASALSPFAMVVVGPLLPDMARLYQTDAAETQFVISAFLFGLFAAQLVLGPVSDRFGRKPVMIGGLIVYVFTSINCAFAPTLEVLIVVRFLQACGAAAVATAVRASVHDVHHGDTAARQMAVIAIGHSVAHTASPMIGGLLDGVLDVRGLFLLLASLGVAMALWAGLAMTETRRLVAPSGRFGVGHALQSSLLVLRSPAFLAYSGIYGLVGAGFFAFLAIGPAFFEQEFGITGAAFGVNWTYMALAFLVGATGGARFVRRFGRQRVFNIFLGLCATIGLCLPGLIALAGASPPTIVAPFVVLSGCLGVISPLALSNAIATQPGMAGTASGLCGALAMAVAGLFTIVAGTIYTGGAYSIVLPMTAAMVLMGLCGAIVRTR